MHCNMRQTDAAPDIPPISILPPITSRYTVTLTNDNVTMTRNQLTLDICCSRFIGCDVAKLCIEF